MIMKFAPFAILLLLAACGPVQAAPPPSDPNALAQWSAQGTAIAVSTVQAAQATRAHVDGTSTAVAFAQQSADATATVVAANSTATWGELLAKEKAAEIAALELSSSIAISGTAEADRAALAFQVQEANLVIAERSAEVARQELWNRIIPWLVGVAILIVMAIVGAVLFISIRMSKPQRAGDNWIIHTRQRGPVVIDQRPQPRALPPPARQLPAPAQQVDEPVMLPQLRNGHVLLAGETGSGKSTIMRTVLAARQNVVVLDPHYSPDEGWGNARVIGAARDYDGIYNYMQQMTSLLTARYQERKHGQLDFNPLTVAIDEMPSIVDALGKDRDALRVLHQWLREGRKVGLYLVLATQSTRVRTLGIEGEKDLLENFTYVLALGDVARKEYGRLVAGMSFPAVLHTKGKARPVVIPAPPVSRPSGADLDGDGDEDAILLPGDRDALFIAPTPVREPDINNLTAEDEERIVQSYRRNDGNIAAVQRELFPSYRTRGGRAWIAIKEVVDAAQSAELSMTGR